MRETILMLLDGIALFSPLLFFVFMLYAWRYWKLDERFPAPPPAVSGVHAFDFVLWPVDNAHASGLAKVKHLASEFEALGFEAGQVLVSNSVGMEYVPFYQGAYVGVIHVRGVHVIMVEICFLDTEGLEVTVLTNRMDPMPAPPTVKVTHLPDATIEDLYERVRAEVALHSAVEKGLIINDTNLVEYFERQYLTGHVYACNHGGARMEWLVDALRNANPSVNEEEITRLCVEHKTQELVIWHQYAVDTYLTGLEEDGKADPINKDPQDFLIAPPTVYVPGYLQYLRTLHFIRDEEMEPLGAAHEDFDDASQIIEALNADPNREAHVEPIWDVTFPFEGKLYRFLE